MASISTVITCSIFSAMMTRVNIHGGSSAQRVEAVGGVVKRLFDVLGGVGKLKV